MVTNKKPFVHFDYHGNANGIGVIKTDKSEKLVEWREINISFRKIYKNSSKRSVLCMSSCKGFNTIKLVAEKDTCPYDYVSGSFESISFKGSFDGYKSFYEFVLDGHELINAGVQIPQSFDKLKFVCLSALQLLKLQKKDI